MFKKVNQYLITHYPLVWNLKLVWILAIGLFLNLTAFINGYLSFYNPSQLLDYNPFNIFYQDLFAIYYFFISLIILIIWLYYYFKNNRFKSNLPTSRNYLFKEFLGVFSVLFLFLCIPTVFTAGLKIHIANLISDEKYAEDVDLINTATPYTLDETYGYSNFSRNLAVPVFDTLVSETDVKKAFQEEIDSLNKELYGNLERKLEEPYFRNPQFNNLLVERLKGKIDLDADDFSHRYNSYQEIIIKEDTLGRTDVEYHSKYFTLNSLYNYSDIQFKVPNHPEKNQKYYDEKLIDVLNRNDRKAIENVLNEFIKICDYYKVGYRFKKKNWIDHIPTAPYFQPKNELNQSVYYVNDNKIEKDYINGKTVIEIYQKIEEAKFSPNHLGELIYFLFTALVLSVLIILFRWTSFKVWLISLIGAGIVGLLLSCFGLLLAIVIDGIEIAYLIPIVAYIIFIVLLSIGLKNNKNKLITGVLLNWVTFATLFIGLILLSCYKNYRFEKLEEKYPDKYIQINNFPEIQKLNLIIDSYFYYQPIVYLIFIYFMIQCFRKWRAMAEE